VGDWSVAYLARSSWNPCRALDCRRFCGIACFRIDSQPAGEGFWRTYQSRHFSCHVALRRFSRRLRNPVCRCSADRFRARSNGSPRNMGTNCCRSTGGICCAPTRSWVVDLGALCNRSRGDGGYRPFGRALPLRSSPYSICALDYRGVGRHRYRRSRNRERWQPKPCTTVRSGNRLWANAVPLGVFVRTHGGSDICRMAATSDSEPPQSTHSPAMWHDRLERHSKGLHRP
jgi:hypothetical protein